MNEIKSIKVILDEANEYIKKGNASQASEKIYKVVEECIKFLSEKNNIPEYEEAKKEGRWWAHLLGRAASKLTKKLNENKINETWSIAYNLHVWGFHENKYGIEDVEPGLPYAKWFFDYIKNSAYVKDEKKD